MLPFTHLSQSFLISGSTKTLVHQISWGYLLGGWREAEGRTKNGKHQRKIWPQIKCLYPTLLYLKLEDEPLLPQADRQAGGHWLDLESEQGPQAGLVPSHSAELRGTCRACWVLLSQGAVLRFLNAYTRCSHVPLCSIYQGLAQQSLDHSAGRGFIQLFPSFLNGVSPFTPYHTSLVLHTNLFHLCVYLPTQPRYKPLRSRGFSALVLGLPSTYINKQWLVTGVQTKFVGPCRMEMNKELGDCVERKMWCQPSGGGARLYS